MHGIETQPLSAVIKGDSDWREYRPLKLPNGVTCVFVHDKESKTTACSVSVGIGASADPRSLSGLAHFTEHMCFLGSAAYPAENEFKSYLSSHGGRSNASTSMSATTYKFDVLAAHAEQVVDIFSNFFIAPLFTESGTGREVNAVDSENSKNMSTDGRRRLQILKALADPTHHYSKFSTGNAKTLPAAPAAGEEGGGRAAFIREALLAFHRRHYTPDNMTVVIVGPQDLDTLEKWIVPRFAKVKNNWKEGLTLEEMSEAERLVEESAKDAPRDSLMDRYCDDNGIEKEEEAAHVPYKPAFQPKIQGNKWPVLLTTRPLQSVRKLYLYVPLPSTRKLGDQSPYSLISHLFGHEGKGSCFAVLQDAELVDALSVGARLSDADQSLLQMQISLTEKGEKYWEDVVNTIFRYCRLLRDTAALAKKGVEDGKGNESLDKMKHIWHELITLRAINFHQTSPNAAYSFAPSLAGNVRVFGTEKCLSVGRLLNETKESLPLENFVEFLELMTPDNCIVERCSQTAWNQLKAKEQGGSTFSDLENGDASTLFGFQKEKWYGVEYHLEPINSSVVNNWNGKTNSSDEMIEAGIAWSNLHLPKENRYIPRDLSLCSDLPEEAKLGPRISKELDPPNLLVNNEFGRLWHRLDDRYSLPKSSLSFLIRNAAVENAWDEETKTWLYDTKASIHTSLLLDVFSDELAQETYDAELAGLHWSVSNSSMGLVFKFSGFNEHLSSFALQMIRMFFNDMRQDESDVCLDEMRSFLCEQHLRTNKDRLIMALSSYLQSKRADSYAAYYTDFLLGSRGNGIEGALSATKDVTLESLREHYKRIISLKGAHVECLYSGNVCSEESRHFFSSAQEIVEVARLRGKEMKVVEFSSRKWTPGPYQRRLEAGADIHLHFQSQNKEEQNGSVLMTFQSSSLPAFKGEGFSQQEHLHQTAAIRTICHMLREPLFNELRTKQQLGYIVNSYYDIGFSSHSSHINLGSLSDHEREFANHFITTPIDSIVVNVLSKKVPPPILTRCIDEFLDSFRERLSTISDDEIKSHTDALSKKLLKPKQKLHDEVGMHFGKICKYAPEVLTNNGPSQLPWDNTKILASTIQGLGRSDLLKAWDNVVAGKTRSRVVSHVYGSTFPLEGEQSLKRNKRNIVSLKSLEDIDLKRRELAQYSNTMNERHFASITKRILEKKHMAAAVLAGAGFLLYAVNALGKKNGQESTGAVSKISSK